MRKPLKSAVSHWQDFITEKLYQEHLSIRRNQTYKLYLVEISTVCISRCKSYNLHSYDEHLPLLMFSISTINQMYSSPPSPKVILLQLKSGPIRGVAYCKATPTKDHPFSQARVQMYWESNIQCTTKLSLFRKGHFSFKTFCSKKIVGLLFCHFYQQEKKVKFLMFLIEPM